jgi:hypothetical protein
MWPGDDRRAGVGRDLPLLAQCVHLAAHLAQLLTIARCQGIATTVVDLGVLHPVSERVIRDPKVLGNAGQGPVSAPYKANRLGCELRGISRLDAGIAGAMLCCPSGVS